MFINISGLRKARSQARFLDRQEELPHSVFRAGAGGSGRGGYGRGLCERALGHLAEYSLGGQVARHFGEENGGDV